MKRSKNRRWDLLKYGNRGDKCRKRCKMCNVEFTFIISAKTPNCCPRCKLILKSLSQKFKDKRYRAKRKNDIINRPSSEGLEIK